LEGAVVKVIFVGKDEGDAKGGWAQKIERQNPRNLKRDQKNTRRGRKRKGCICAMCRKSVEPMILKGKEGNCVLIITRSSKEDLTVAL